MGGGGGGGAVIGGTVGRGEGIALIIIQDGVIPILDELCFDFIPELIKKEV